MKTYTPTQVKFKNPKVIHEFEDGWTVLELTEPEDLLTCGKATQNCINESWAGKLLLEREFTEDEEREFLRQSFKAQWDTPERRKNMGDAYVERMVAGAETCPLPKRSYKVAALVDAENRCHAAIILGEQAQVLEGKLSYGSYRDLGQDSVVTLDGREFMFLQATYGTSWMPKVVAERCAEWWKHHSAGDWVQDKFESSVHKYNPKEGVNTYRPAMAYR